MKKTLLFMTLMVLLSPWALKAAELTVCEGTSGTYYAPVWGAYVDIQGTTAEFIIPATTEGMDELSGGTITKLTFYIDNNPSGSWVNSVFKVYMGEVEGTTIASLGGPSTYNVVFTGGLDNTQSTMEIVLNTPYTYHGGNLLIGTYVQAAGTCKGTLFVGVDADYGCSRCVSGNDNGNSYILSTLPKTTFTYIPDEAPACARPKDLTVSNLSARAAQLSWTDNSSSEWVIAYKASTENNFTEITGITATSYTLTGLTPETSYIVKVRSVCSNSVSAWSNLMNFTTLVSCPAPTDLAVQLTPGNGTVASLGWTAGAAETDWVLEYGTASNFTGAASVNISGEPSYALTGLTPETTYFARVKANCGDLDGESVWGDVISFTPTNIYLHTVNDGPIVNTKIPIPGSWLDEMTRTQFIIPAADLDTIQWGTINRLIFYSAFNNDVYWVSSIFEVYMAEVSDSTLSAFADFESMERVKNEVQLEVHNNKLEVTLGKPFLYTGGNLMIGFLQTLPGGTGVVPFYGDTVKGAAISCHGTTVELIDFLPKVSFDYTPGVEPPCKTPTKLAVEYNGGTEATVSWAGEADTFNLQVNDETPIVVAGKSYVLTSLELGTAYDIKVQADCGDTISDWASVSFATDFCMPENRCEITIVLTDPDASDGWNSNRLEVVDDITGRIMGSYTLAPGWGEKTFKLNVCNGRKINFMYRNTGRAQYENGYVVMDVNGDTLFHHEGCLRSHQCTPPTAGLIASYVADCTITDCKYPANLVASVTDTNSVNLSWTKRGDATEWIVAYKRTTDLVFSEVNVTTNQFVLKGLDDATAYTIKVRPVCDVDNRWSNEVNVETMEACPVPTALSADASARYATISWNAFSDRYNVRYRGSNALIEGFENGFGQWTTIDHDGDGYTWHLQSELGNVAPSYATTDRHREHSGRNAVISASYYSGIGALRPSNWLVSPQVTLGGSISFYAQAGMPEYPYEKFAVYVSTAGNTNIDDFVLAGGWWKMDGNGWHRYEVDLSEYSGKGYIAICHYDTYDQYFLVVDDIEIKSPLSTGYSWSDISNITAQSITLNNLSPEALYDVRVQGVCGNDKTAWADLEFFTDSVYELTISAAKYATFYERDKAYVLPEGVNGYVFSLDNTPKLALAYEAGDTVAADIPLLLHHANAGTYDLIYTDHGEGLAPGLNNDLIGVQEAQEIEAASGHIYYMLSTAKPAPGESVDYNSVGFYWPNSDGKQNFMLPAHRAYLDYLESDLQGACGAPSILFGDNNATSLGELKGGEGVLKFIREGHIYILREGIIYDVLGHIVK